MTADEEDDDTDTPAPVHTPAPTSRHASHASDAHITALGRGDAVAVAGGGRRVTVASGDDQGVVCVWAVTWTEPAPRPFAADSLSLDTPVVRGVGPPARAALQAVPVRLGAADAAGTARPVLAQRREDAGPPSAPTPGPAPGILATGGAGSDTDSGGVGTRVVSLTVSPGGRRVVVALWDRLLVLDVAAPAGADVDSGLRGGQPSSMAAGAGAGAGAGGRPPPPLQCERSDRDDYSPPAPADPGPRARLETVFTAATTTAAAATTAASASDTGAATTTDTAIEAAPHADRRPAAPALPWTFVRACLDVLPGQVQTTPRRVVTW